MKLDKLQSNKIELGIIDEPDFSMLSEEELIKVRHFLIMQQLKTYMKKNALSRTTIDWVTINIILALQIEF